MAVYHCSDYNGCGICTPNPPCSHTFSVGSTTTLPPGMPAFVEERISGTHHRLDFGLPQGDHSLPYAAFQVVPAPYPRTSMLSLCMTRQNGNGILLSHDGSTLRLAAGFVYQVTYSTVAPVRRFLGLMPIVNGITDNANRTRSYNPSGRILPVSVSGSFLLTADCTTTLRFQVETGENRHLNQIGTVSVIRIAAANPTHQ